MSKKKDRGWFICPQWAELISRHYASDIEAGRALKADPKVLSKLRSGTPVRIRTQTCRATLLSSSASAFSQCVTNARDQGETLRLMTERL